MTTPKKPTVTGSHPGENDPYMQLLNDHRLYDSDMTWMEHAKCKGRTDITFFPEPGESHLMVNAKKFCNDCPVRERCLRWAVTNQIPYGVWGGQSANERKKLLPNNIKGDIIDL